MRKLYSSGCSKHVLAFGVMFFLLILCDQVNAQTRRYVISGKVTDAKTKETLPGVAVRLTSTAFAMLTTIDGSYSLVASLNPGQYTVSFSYIGYKTLTKTIELGTSDAVTVDADIIQDAVGLDEVIITGTSEGTTRRQLGNYVGSVSGEDLNKNAGGNVLSGLQGKVAGAQISQNQGDPAGGISVRLRGISSVNSSSDPLYIIDGVIANNTTSRVTDNQQNRLVDINPADIERVEILNGAAAAAIYGSRANAGVVQIFTKRGTSGEPQVSFSSTYMNSELRKKLPVNMAPVKFGGPTDGPGAFTQDILPISSNPLTFATNTTPVTRYDYQDYIFRNASGVDNNVSVSGGNDKTKFYTSASYFTNQGIVKNTDFTRFGLRANVDQVLSKWATIRGGLAYTNSNANEKPYGNGLIVPVGIQWIIANFHDIQRRDALGNLPAIGERGRVNPVSIIEDIKQRSGTNRILANAGIKLFPLKGLTVDFNLGVDNAASQGTLFIPPYAYNVSTAEGSWGGGVSLDPALNGHSRKALASQYFFNNDLNVTYNFDITSRISSTSQIGYSQQYENQSRSIIQGRGLAPEIESVGGASTILVSTDERTEYSVLGSFFQQNFKINNNFFVTGAVRLDGSSVFGEGQRNQMYMKGSASYVISDTKFWQGLGTSWLNVFKIRAAYGESGNMTGIAAYDRFNSYNVTSYLGRTSLQSRNQLANTDVKPERQNEFEFGTDLFFLDNRIGFTMNIYNKKVSDLLLERQIAPTTGYSTLLDNFGSLENKGIELLMQLNPIRKTDFNWNATVIFNRNRNKATNVGSGVTAFANTSSGPVSLINNQPLGLYYGSYFARDESGNLLLTPTGLPQTERGIQNDPLNPTPQRTNGQPSGSVLRKVIGNPNPDWNGSIVNELSYKKLGFRFQLDTEQGGERWAADWRTSQGVGAGKVAEQEHLGLVPRGFVNANYNIEEWRSQEANWIKLREVALTYRLGNIRYLKDMTLSVSGRNLVSWDNFEAGYDPEVNSGGQSSIVRGIDFGAVPVPRSFNFGIQAKF